MNWTDQLLCFSSTGRVLWDFVPGKTVTSNGRTYAPPYRLATYQVVRSGPVSEIVATSIHQWSFPDQVVVLDQAGKVKSQYWHRGHVTHMALADLDHDGESEVLLGGVNDADEYKQATLLIFDHRRIAGSAARPTGDPYFDGLGPGTEKAIVRFPKTWHSLAQEFNRVHKIAVGPDRVTVYVAEGISEFSPAVIYELDYNLRVLNVTMDDEFVSLYRRQHPEIRIDEEKQRLAREVTVTRR